jgi:hypothetical protein
MGRCPVLQSTPRSKLKLQAEIEGRIDIEDAHDFTQRPEVAPMTFGEARVEWVASRKAFDNCKVDFQRGVSGKVKKGRVANDPTRQKRKYKFKSGRRPINSRTMSVA